MHYLLETIYFLEAKKKQTLCLHVWLFGFVHHIYFNFFLSFLFFVRLSVYRFKCGGVLAFVHSCLFSLSFQEIKTKAAAATTRKKRSNSNQCHLSCDVVHFVAARRRSIVNCKTQTHKCHINRLLLLLLQTITSYSM